MLLALYLLNAELANFNPHRLLNNEHFILENDEQPYFILYHKDLIIKTYEDNETEIIYENLERIKSNENTRDTLLRLHFNDSYPSFYIMNEDYFFYDGDATWIDSTTAEISVPNGIYKIYTIFNIEFLYKVVIRYDVDLTLGAGFHEVWIEHNEATNVLELNSCDINGEPFNMSEKYYANFTFHFLNENFYYLLIHRFFNQIVTSDFTEDFNLVAGELKFDEENVYITQYGPIQEITSSQSFSNEPTDYCSQQIILQIPVINEYLKIGIANTLWVNSISPFYTSLMSPNNLFECSEEQWSTNLYMMDHDYEQCGSTSMIFLGYFENNNWKDVYDVAPFHCIDDKIGSFWHPIPMIVDYLSPSGEQLVFGQSPIYIEIWHVYFDNMLYPWSEHWGSDNVHRTFDVYNSTFILTDSNGSVIMEGELIDMGNLNVPEDIYTLTVENNNFSLAGLPGTCTLMNYFNTTLEMPNPPFINSLIIFNEDNEPVNRLEYNENATLLFSVADVEFIDSYPTYFPVITDSVKVFYKLHEEEDWQELETEFIDEFPEFGNPFGKIFSADLSEVTATDSVAYDLKIHFEDNEENYTELILEPAFVVGNFEATSLSDEAIQNNYSKDHYQISNYPNPFNPETNIVFNLPEEGEVQIDIFNIKGQKINSLVNEQLLKGEHSIVWDGENASGKKVGSGLYLYKLIVNGKTEIVKKCMLLK